MRDAFDVALRRRGQPGKRLSLPCAADARSPLGYGDDASPGRRKRHTGDERTTLVAIRSPSALDDKTAILEGPGTDRGTLAASDRARECARIARHAVELGERPRDGERELCP